MSDAPGDQPGRTPGTTPTRGDWSRWRIPMTVLVVATFVFTWAYVPRHATSVDLARDLAAGAVVVVDPSPPSDRRVGPSATVDVGRGFAREVRWQTRDGRVYQAPVTWLEGRRDVDLARTVVATADAAGAPEPRIGPLSGGAPRVVSDAAPLVLWVVLVGLLVVSPAPRRLTKWAVFWLLPAAGGLGALWWLWRDAPWDPVANGLPEVVGTEEASGRRRRTRGWVTFVILLVVDTLFSAVFGWGFTHVFGHAAGSGPVEWSVVDHGGRVSTWVER